MIVIAISILVVAVVTGVYEISYGALGPFIAGFVNLLVAVTIGGRAAAQPTCPDSLNEDGRALLRNLILSTDIGRRPPLSLTHPNHMKGGRRSLTFPERVRILQPNEAVVERLETIFFQYNRLLGAVDALSEMGDDRAALAKRLRPAAEEAVADALNTSAGLAEFPESSQRALAALGRIESGLSEMADRSEALTTETSPLPGGSSRPFDRALEELRLAEKSHKELEEVLEQKA